MWEETLKPENIQRRKQNDMWILEPCHFGNFRKDLFLQVKRPLEKAYFSNLEERINFFKLSSHQRRI